MPSASMARWRAAVAEFTAIVETLRPGPNEIQLIGASDRVIAIRGAYVPIVDIGATLGFRPPLDRLDSTIMVLVEGDQEARVALAVDLIQDQRQVVIKSLETNYMRVDGIAAATILGDGRVAMILDVDELVALRHHERGVGGGRVGRDRDRRYAHHLADRGTEIAPGKHDTSDHVLAREDAERPPVGIHDWQRPDPAGLHRGQRLLEHQFRRRSHRRAAHQAMQWRRHVVARGDAADILGLHGRAQHLKQIGEAARAEIAKRRRFRDQRVELGSGEHEAGRVLRRAVDRRDAALPEQRAQRKHLAGGQFPKPPLRSGRTLALEIGAPLRICLVPSGRRRSLIRAARPVRPRR